MIWPDFYANLSVAYRARNRLVYGAFLDVGPTFTRYRLRRVVTWSWGMNRMVSARRLTPFVTQRVTIPRYGDAESLNVGIATAVLLDNWRRTLVETSC